MKHLFPLAIVAVLISCGDNNSEASVDNNLKNESELSNDTIFHVDKIQEVSFNPNSPEGWVLGEYFASDDNEYIFCPDGRLLFDNHARQKLEGSWQLINDTLHLNYTKQINEIGVGKPLPMPEAVPGNYVDQYESYKTEEKSIVQNEFLIWSEIKTYLDEDSSYPYAINSYNYNCK